MALQLIHNPRCSKSREAKAILDEAGVDYEVLEYLKNPLTIQELEELAQKLKLSPRQMVRTKEDEYQKHRLDRADATDAQFFKAMAADPVLLERPILVAGKKAVIGRPPELIKELL
jgi:arsenate reductase